MSKQQSNRPADVAKMVVLNNLKMMYKDSFPPELVEKIFVASNRDLDKAIMFLNEMKKNKEAIRVNPQRKEEKQIKPLNFKPMVKAYGKDQIKKNPQGNNVTNSKSTSQGTKPSTTSKPLVQNIKVAQTGDINKFKADAIINNKQNPLPSTNTGAIPKVSGKTKQPLLSYTPDKNAEKKLRRKQLIDSYKLMKQMKDPVDRIKAYINSDIRVLVIMRGCPGSGKTSYVKKLLTVYKDLNQAYHVFSADDFFICENTGTYQFNPEKLPNAHEWVQDVVLQALKDRRNPIIVDNTNTRLWEMKPYATMAIQYGYVVETLEPPIKPWSSNADFLARKTVHFVPKHVINKMLERYDANISGEDLIGMLQLNYDPTQLPPQTALPINTPPSKKLLSKMVLPKKSEINQKKPEKNIKYFVNDFFMNNDVNSFSNNEISTKNTSVSQNLIDLSDLDFSLISTNDSKKHTNEQIVQSCDEVLINSELNSSKVTHQLEEITINSKSVFDYITEHANTETFPIDDSNKEYVLINSDQTITYQKFHEENKGANTLIEFQSTTNILPILESESTKIFPDEFNDFLNSWLLDAGVKNGGSVSDTRDTEQNSKQDKSASGSYCDILCDWNLSNEKEGEEVTPLEDFPKDQRQKVVQMPKKHDTTVQDAATNTNYIDFEILNNLKYGVPSTEKIILGKPTFISSKCSVPVNKRVFMLERGTMTLDIETNRIEQLGSGLYCLTQMFPQVPYDSLAELFEKCGRDIDWTAGLLLDSGQQISETFTAFELEKKLSEDSKQTVSSQNTESETALPELETNKKDESNNLKYSKKAGKGDGSGVSEELIKHMEKSFVISDESYSDRIRRVRGTYNNSHYSLGKESKKNDTLISNEDDTVLTLPQDDSVQEVEEEVSLPIGKNVIMSLQNRFGGFIPSNMIGEEVMVDLPISLARQFYSYVMDSALQQVDNQETLCDEDEMLAIQLQEEECFNYEKTDSTTPNLREIMDKELALSVYKSQMKDNNGKGSETVAGKLSKQLLIERFPNMDPRTLTNLFEDTDKSLHQTMVLLQSAGHIPKPLPPKPLCEADKNLYLSREEVILQANAYKDVASKLYDLRKDCITKAKQAIQNGNKDVAMYYTEMAKWHMKQIKQANWLAVNKLLTVHGQKTGSASANTIDLHFLHVSEAVQILDLFLDAHVRNLISGGSSQNKRPLYIITGRGAHSLNGKSRIRPAVQSKLAKRNIQYSVENPGLLKAFVTRKTALSCRE